MVAPDALVDLLAGDHLAGALDQVGQQLDFAARERHDFATAAHLIALQIDDAVTEGEDGGHNVSVVASNDFEQNSNKGGCKAAFEATHG